MPGDQGIQVGAASVRHQKYVVPDGLHIQDGGGEGGGAGDQTDARLRDQNGFLWIESGTKFPADGGEIVPVVGLVVPAAEIAAAHVHIGKIQFVFLRDFHRRAGQRSVDVHCAGLGGRVQMQAGNLHVGEGAQGTDDFGKRPVFIAVAEAAAFLLHQHLLRAEGSDVTVDPKPYGKGPVGEADGKL